MYVYEFNSIRTKSMNNGSDEDIIKSFTSLTEDLKIQVINPGFDFMNNKASTALNPTTKTMNIKYQ